MLDLFRRPPRDQGGQFELCLLTGFPRSVLRRAVRLLMTVADADLPGIVIETTCPEPRAPSITPCRLGWQKEHPTAARRGKKGSSGGPRPLQTFRPVGSYTAELAPSSPRLRRGTQGGRG